MNLQTKPVKNSGVSIAPHLQFSAHLLALCIQSLSHAAKGFASCLWSLDEKPRRELFHSLESKSTWPAYSSPPAQRIAAAPRCRDPGQSRAGFVRKCCALVSIWESAG